ncbi:metal ABC transporter ATP-binding protein [Marinicrinis sediminis]|uniref:Metal ABC transporter ATP-binding protein n=1 Tax=Marinicrinis sediminis TaxID=1652465 RepID=A0ABW5RCR6_9BACL
MLLASMKDVIFGYGSHPVLDGVQLELHQGEFVCLTGPNGASKTTMLRLLLGLLKPWSGHIQMATHNEAGRKITYGYVPQQVASFNRGFPSTVLELVRSGRYEKLGLFRRFTQREENIVEACLKQVGMWEHRHAMIGELSGGQKQRICIARTLAQEPDVFVLDEPTAGMDEETRKGFYAMLQHHVTEHGRTVIMITHDMDEVEPYVDRRIQLERGERGGWKCFSTALCNVHFGPGD